MLKKLVFLFLGLIPFINNIAQPPLHTLLRKEEGLNNNTSWSTNTLLLDSFGFVWIATQSGLNRYDGYSIKSFNGLGQPPYDLPYSRISAMVQDQRGMIWLGTQEEGILLFNPFLESFTRFETASRLPDSIQFGQINRLAIDHDGHLIIGTAFQGMFKYEIEKDVLTQIRIDQENISSRSINNFFITSQGQLIVLAFNGLYLETPADTFIHLPMDSRVFLSDAVEWPDGRIFLYSTNTPFYYLLDPPSQTLTIHPGPDGKVICHCFIDPAGQLWLNTYDGLYRGDTAHLTKELFPFSTDLAENKINICTKDMITDRQGRIYYNSQATGAGRWQYSSSPFKAIYPAEFGKILYRNSVMYLSKGNELWKVTNGVPVPVLLENQPSDLILDFLITKNGDYWIQYFSDQPACIRYNPEGKLMEHVRMSRASTQYLELQDGRILNGLNHTGAGNENPFEFIGAFFEQLSGKKYPDFGTHYFTQLRNGDIWMATFASGIIRLTDQLTKYQIMPIDPKGQGKLNSNNPYYMYEARSGHVLVCTDKGINVWDPVTETFSYIMEDNMELQEIKGMVEGKNGEIWILLTSEIWQYTLSDRGLRRYHLHPDFRSYAWQPSDLQIDEKGYIFYLGEAGVIQLDPDALENHAGPHPVLFTDLYINRQRVYPGDAYGILDSAILYQRMINIPYTLRDIGFSFVSVQGHDVNATYYYRLAGYRDDWHQAPEDRTLHFTNLSPGQYRFEVKAQSGNGKWTQAVSSVSIRIEAPWHQRWWAYVLYTITASSIAYGFYRYRVNELLKYQALRTKISSDLHDDVGTILGSIAMESEMLSYQSAPDQVPVLQRLSQLSREAMGRMRDTVWAIDSRKDNLTFLTDRMKDYLAETLSRSKFSYQFENRSELQDKHISPDVRQNVYLIFKEAINNILKHSNGQTVEVIMAQENSKFILTITDNGSVTKPINTSGLGLSNMKMRAEIIRAELNIDVATGFKITLRFDTGHKSKRL